MSIRAYAPGRRKGNRWFVARGRLGGEQVEFVCTDESGEKTADAGAARRCIKRFEEAFWADRRAAEALAPGRPHTFAEAAERYMDARNIRGMYRLRISRFLTVVGHLPLAEVRQADIDIAAAAAPPHWADSTVNRCVYSPAAAILHYAAESDWCAYRRIRLRKEPEPERRRPPENAEALLLANTDGIKRALVLTIFRQGWRIGETMQWRWDKISLTERTTELYVRKVKRWKIIELHDDVVAALASLPGDKRTGFVFPWRRHNQVYRWLEPLCKKLGFYFTPHMARHEFASRVHEAGGTARDIVDAGSWTHIDSTQRYIGASRSHVRDLLHRAGKNGGKTR